MRTNNRMLAQPSKEAREAAELFIRLDTAFDPQDAILKAFGVETLFEGSFDLDGNPEPYLKEIFEEARRQLGVAFDMYAAMAIKQLRGKGGAS